MKLNATVTAVESGRNRSDGQQQIKIKVSGAEAGFNAIIVPNTDNLALDEGLVVLVLTKEVADYLYHYCNGDNRNDKVTPEIIASELRPDPPVPFLTEEAANATATA